MSKLQEELDRLDNEINKHRETCWGMVDDAMRFKHIRDIRTLNDVIRSLQTAKSLLNDLNSRESYSIDIRKFMFCQMPFKNKE